MPVVAVKRLKRRRMAPGPRLGECEQLIYIAGHTMMMNFHDEQCRSLWMVVAVAMK